MIRLGLSELSRDSELRFLRVPRTQCCLGNPTLVFIELLCIVINFSLCLYLTGSLERETSFSLYNMDGIRNSIFTSKSLGLES